MATLPTAGNRSRPFRRLDTLNIERPHPSFSFYDTFMTCRSVTVFIIALTLCLRAHGTAPMLAPPFGDNMILQREMSVPVWGTADAGSQIQVTFAGQTQSTTTDAQGKWMLKLDPMSASAENRALIVSSGAEKTEFKDVLVGEVWVCSGQSNMEMGIGMCLDVEKEIAAANDPLLRIRAINKVFSPIPTSTLPTASAWLPTTPQAVSTAGAWGGFSGAAYFFARHLRQELKVPVGVVQSSWGGTLIEPWTPSEGFAMVPSLKTTSEWLSKVESDYRTSVTENLDAIAAFEKSARAAIANNTALPLPPPAITYPINSGGQATALYNGHIHPLVPYAIRGALWYQGESNLFAGDTEIYIDKMKALIGGWRKVWGQGDFPFYFVQLAPYTYPFEATRLPAFWVAQTKAAETIPNTGMAVINDIGDFKDIHPKNKQEVGRRLALLALANTYGVRIPESTGPQFKSFAIKGNLVGVTFDHTGTGIKTLDGKALTGFEIAGEDDVFFPASATAKGDHVILQSDQVPAPTRARYAWNQCPVVNATNSGDLPMNAFQTPGPPNLALHATYTSTNPNTHGFGATGQLTDGSWIADAQHCFATNEDVTFPKDQVIDLGKPCDISRIKFGVPPFGSTKTIVVSISADNTTFTEVGKHEFAQNQAETVVIKTDGNSARYIKLSSPDHHDPVVQYPNTFIFLSEVEVYGK
jgi:sialate O-acetylesterase